MALIRWEPARELQSLRYEMDRLFGTLFDSQAGGGVAASSGTALRRWTPAMDLVDEGERFVLRADLPGVREDDLSIEFEENVLRISGERKSEQQDRSEGYYRVERARGSFSRALVLPEGVDPDAIEAHFDNGVLELSIPKPEQRKPRRVAINVGENAAGIERSESAAA